MQNQGVIDFLKVLKRLGTMIPLEYFRDNSFNAQDLAERFMIFFFN